MVDLFSGSIDLLNDALSGLSRRQQAIANNIANAETPGFKRAEVRFEELLRRRAEQAGSGEAPAHPGHLPLEGPAAFVPEVLAITNTAGRPDGNNVEVEGEMGRLLQNELSYNAASQLMARKLAELRLVITEGR